MFREFQEKNLSPNVANRDNSELMENFTRLFELHELSPEETKTSILIKREILEKKQALYANKLIGNPWDQEYYERSENSKDLEKFKNNVYHFDIMLTQYIFSDQGAYEVRLKALQVLIGFFG